MLSHSGMTGIFILPQKRNIPHCRDIVLWSGLVVITSRDLTKTFTDIC